MRNTITITPEERAQWRRLAAAAEFCDVKNIPFPHSDVTRLLNALEAAEAELAHVRLAAGSDRYDEVTSDLIDAVQKAEAENARLRAERDWLVAKLADISDKVNKDRALPFCAACNICPVGDDEMEGRTCAVAIAEAAQQAAKGE